MFLKQSNGILIVGANHVSRLIGVYLERNERHVVLIDSNEINVAKAKASGLEAFKTNIYSDALVDNIELSAVGYLMAITANSDINKYAIDKFSQEFGENGSFRLVTQDEMLDEQNNPKEGLFSQTDDYANLDEVAKKYPAIQEIKLKGNEHYLKLIAMSKMNKEVIPLFLKDAKGDLSIIPSDSESVKNIEADDCLVYLGKTFED